MPDNLKKEDLRILKTHKSLMTALFKLLELRNFNQITVNDLCEEALISRTTFYLHFHDKYDFLKYWFTNINSGFKNKKNSYEDMEKDVNDFVNNNKKVIKNLIENANSETSGLLCDFILLLLNINIGKADKEQANLKEVVLNSILGGGMLHYLLWQVENKFPSKSPVMNPLIYDIIINLKNWDKNQK